MRTLVGLLFSALFIGIGIISFLVFSSKVTLTCMRPSNMPHYCEIVSRGKLQTQKQQIQLADITSVSVEKHTDWLRKRGPHYKYRVVFNTKSGVVPLTIGYSSRSTNPQRTADQIKTFLQRRSQPSLKIEQTDSGIAMIVGVVFWAIGGTLGKYSLHRTDE